MPQFNVDKGRISIFPVGDEYLFTHYFDRKDVFNELRRYYNKDYRFEIREGDTLISGGHTGCGLRPRGKSCYQRRRENLESVYPFRTSSVQCRLRTRVPAGARVC